MAGVGGRYAGDTADARAYSHYITSVVYHRNGRFEDAVDELRRAVDLAPAEMSLRLKLVRSYMRLRDLDSARRMCEEALELSPDDPALWMVLGWLYQQLERYDQAVDALSRAVQLKPDNALGYEVLIRAADEANDLVTTLGIYEKLIELQPDSAELHYQLGYNLVRIHDVDRAREALEQTLALDPEFVRARNLLGLVYLDLDLNEEAARQFASYVEKTPDDLRAREHLAAANARQGNFESALALLDGTIAHADSTVSHRLERTYVLLRSGRCSEVAPSDVPAEAPIVGSLMQILVRKGMGRQYGTLVESLDEIESDIDGECNDYLIELVFLFGKDDAGGFFAQALGELLSEGAQSKAIQTMLSRVYMALDRDEEAETLLLAALDSFGPDKWLHYYLATIYEEADRVRDAETHLKACLELDPLDPEIMNFLGYMYAEEAIELDEAERLLVRALEIDPDNAYYLDSLGWVYYRKGEADRAIDLIRRAIFGMDTDDAILRDHLGDAYLLRGDLDKAIAEWEHALRLDPKIEGVREKLESHADGRE